MAESNGAEISYTSADNTYVFPEKGQNFDPNGVGFGQPVSERRRDVRLKDATDRVLGVVDVKFDHIDDDEVPEVDENLGLLGYGNSLTEVDTALRDVRQSFGADAEILEIVESLDGPTELNFDDIGSGFALSGVVKPSKNLRILNEDGLAAMSRPAPRSSSVKASPEARFGDLASKLEQVAESRRSRGVPDGRADKDPALAGLTVAQFLAQRKSGGEQAVE